MRRRRRHGGVVRVAELVVQRVEDGHRRVEADQVEQRERPHREVAAALHRGVDVVHRRRAVLQHAHGVVEVGEQQGVDDEAGAVLHLDGVLAAAPRRTPWPRRWSRRLAVSGRMTSTSFIDGAGLKKWMPHTCSGRSVCDGQLDDRQRRGVGGEDGVGLARSASSSANSAFLTSRSSTTDSITRSQSARSASSAVAVMRAEDGRPLGLLQLALGDLLGQALVDARPGWRRPWPAVRDRSTTSYPAWAATSAMPAPMIPDPTMPTRSTSMGRRYSPVGSVTNGLGPTWDPVHSDGSLSATRCRYRRRHERRRSRSPRGAGVRVQLP